MPKSTRHLNKNQEPVHTKHAYKKLMFVDSYYLSIHAFYHDKDLLKGQKCPSNWSTSATYIFPLRLNGIKIQKNLQRYSHTLTLYLTGFYYAIFGTRILIRKTQKIKDLTISNG